MQEGALSGAGCPHDGEEFAPINVEVHALEDVDHVGVPAVGFVQVIGDEHVRSLAWIPESRSASVMGPFGSRAPIGRITLTRTAAPARAASTPPGSPARR